MSEGSAYALVNKADRPHHPVEWRFFTDSDHAGNADPINKRKSRFGYIATVNGFPVMYKSTTTSVAMASPQLGGNHAEDSSAGAEIYGASNATKSFMHLSYVVDEMNLFFPKPFYLEYDLSLIHI